MSLERLLRPGDTILVGTGTGEPLELIGELVRVAGRIGGLQVIQVMTGGSEQLAEASGPGLRLRTPVPGTKARRAIAEGRAELLAQCMSQLAGGIVDGSLRIDGVLMQARRWDARRVTPGLIADLMLPAWERARFRALELNDRLPRIACDSTLRLEAADHVVHSSRAPNELAEDPVSEAAVRIGESVADIVPDGATIELGVGRALAGVVPALAAGRRNLAMHTGIVGNAAMRLIEAGCVSRAVRGTAWAVGATAMGTAAFYAWADAHPHIALVDSRIAHASKTLAALPRFVAINGGLQIDLQGNVNSTVYKGRTISGAGGAPDFAAAGAAAQASVIALFATGHDGSPGIVERVEAVSVPGNLVTHVVTEHGVAGIRGLAGAARARALAAIAAPAHREALLAAAARFA